MSRFSTTRQAPEGKLRAQFATARYDLLAVVILTALNVFLLLGNTGSYFLFSASVPYAIVDLGMLLCGLYPPELYEGEMADIVLFDGGVIAVFVALALVIIAVYLLLFFLSKQHPVALTVAVVLFALDTLFLLALFGLDLSMLLDLLFHGWLLFTAIRGILAARKLKVLPSEEEGSLFPTGMPERDENAPYTEEADTAPLRAADMAVKHRVLLEERVRGHHVLYRRVKRTNELVIDGRAYAEYTALFEKAHLLRAVLDGHVYAAGFDGTGISFILLDDEPIAEKRRWY